MTPYLILAAWTLTGVVISALLTPEPGSRFAWAPFALVLGPLWLAVAAERPGPLASIRAQRPARQPRAVLQARPVR